jgi:hypothetical protein
MGGIVTLWEEHGNKDKIHGSISEAAQPYVGILVAAALDPAV